MKSRFKTAPPIDPALLSRERIAQQLATHRPAPASRLMKRAAVAAVLRFDRDEPEVLLMQRAIRARDRWSGQVSFPGGREELIDRDLRATAVRETREEVGLDLNACAQPMGRLSSLRAVARGGLQPLTITPFVFEQVEPAPLSLSDEAVETFWLPLGRAASGELASRYTWKAGPVPLDIPCWRYQGFVVWGLTFRMLSGLLTLIAAD